MNDSDWALKSAASKVNKYIAYFEAKGQYTKPRNSTNKFFMLSFSE